MFSRRMIRIQGFSSVEVAIGVSIAALTVTFMMHTVVKLVTFGTDNLDRARAVLLAEEGIELMRFLRDSSWTNISSLSNGTRYDLLIATTTIATTTNSVPINTIYTRSITTSSVYRATAGSDIVASTSGVAKAIDTNTVLVTVSVSWGTPTSTVSLSSYLTNI